MKNTLGDLNNHLFMQLERLNDEDLNDDELVKEVGRAKAINETAKMIISNGSLVLDAKKLQDDRMDADAEFPRMLEG